MHALADTFFAVRSSDGIVDLDLRMPKALLIARAVSAPAARDRCWSLDVLRCSRVRPGLAGGAFRRCTAKSAAAPGEAPERPAPAAQLAGHPQACCETLL